MKEINDDLFVKFVLNAMPKEDMAKAEDALRQSNECAAAVAASIVNYEANASLMQEMMGEMEASEKISEKNHASHVGNVPQADSINANKQKNKKEMNTQITLDELKAIQDLKTKFQNSYRAELTLEENLVNFYMTECPGAFPEDAKNIVKGLEEGVESFNTNLKQALENGAYDYAAELDRITAGMNNNEKMQIYVNFLAALRTITVDNLSDKHHTQETTFADNLQKLEVTGEVTDEMLDEARKQIAELLDNNTVCLGTIEGLKQIVNSLPQGSQMVEHTLGNVSDVRDKEVAALATYIAYQRGELPSFGNQPITPQMIGANVAAGIETASIINSVNNGTTTLQEAWKALKFIGGLAVILALSTIMGLAMLSLGGVLYSAFLTYFGATTMGTMLAGMTTALFGLQLFVGSVSVLTTVDSWVGSPMQAIADFIEEKIWPSIKGALESTWNWLQGLFGRNTVQQHTQQQTQQGSNVAPSIN